MYQDITSIEDPVLLSECVDYTDLAILSVLESIKMYNDLEFEQLITESKWIQSCLEAGLIVPVVEDDEQKTTFKSRSTGSMRDIINAIKLWIDEIVAKIRKSAVKRADKYVPWILDVENQLIDAAGTMSGGVSMTPYYNGNWSSDIQTTTSAINQAISSLQAKKIDDFSFANDIVDPAVVADSSKDMSDYVKNYYRFGKKNIKTINKEKLVGSNLAEKVPSFIAYLKSYQKTIPDGIKKMSNAYNPNKIAKLAASEEAVPESLSPYTHLSIEDRMIFESLLSSMINYEIVKEYSKNTQDDKEKLDNKVEQIESPKDNQQESNNQSNTNSSTRDSNNNEDNQPKADEPDTTNYLARIEYFVKLAITGYATACDERFCKYIDILKIIAKTKGIPLPKWTDSGEYIPVANRKDEDTSSKSESTDNNESESDNSEDEQKSTNKKGLFKLRQAKDKRKDNTSKSDRQKQKIREKALQEIRNASDDELKSKYGFSKDAIKELKSTGRISESNIDMSNNNQRAFVSRNYLNA